MAEHHHEAMGQDALQIQESTQHLANSKYDADLSGDSWSQSDEEYEVPKVETVEKSDHSVPRVDTQTVTTQCVNPEGPSTSGAGSQTFAEDKTENIVVKEEIADTDEPMFIEIKCEPFLSSEPSCDGSDEEETQDMNTKTFEGGIKQESLDTLDEYFAASNNDEAIDMTIQNKASRQQEISARKGKLSQCKTPLAIASTSKVDDISESAEVSDSSKVEDDEDELTAEVSDAEDTKGNDKDTDSAGEKQRPVSLKQKPATSKIKVPHKCDLCGKEFNRRKVLARHMLSHTGEKPFKCSVCHKGFADTSGVTRHMRLHTGERPFKCGECGKAFKASSHLTSHMRQHTGEKPFKCSLCNKDFADMTTMTRHVRTHTGERPYKCTVCEKSFGQNNHLTAHMRQHTGEKPFNCNLCNKTFANMNSVARHMRLHSGEKPHKCTVCGKAFNEKHFLITHMRTHTGEKPFVCTVCGKAFTEKSGLTVHFRLHTGETPYKCQICEKAFRKSSQATAHMRIHFRDSHSTADYV